MTAFVAGAGVKGTSAAEAAQIKGLDKVLAVENEAYEKVSFILYLLIEHETGEGKC